MKSNLIVIILLVLGTMLCGCARQYQYKVDQFEPIPINAKFPGSVSLQVASQDVFNYSWGYNDYKINLKEAITKQYNQALKGCFQSFVTEGTAQTRIGLTVLDVNVFPIEGLWVDFRVFIRAEILNEKSVKQKTTVIYGIGSAPTGDKALEKAINNSIYQLIPYLEELFTQ